MTQSSEVLEMVHQPYHRHYISIQIKIQQTRFMTYYSGKDGFMVDNELLWDF